MLKNLHIENIAVIEQADIAFYPGFSVLSGETGAGKSIIIDSINAVLGNRTSKDIIRTGADFALVSAVFENKNVDFWLEENDIPSDDEELILQRKITAAGKTSCRISGVPVTTGQMRELASILIDIHGQNDGLRLLDEKSHIDFLDIYGVDSKILDSYKGEYKKYCDIINEIDSLTMDESEKLHLNDSLRFTIDEIEKAQIKSGEYDSLISQRDLLRNSEKLKEALDSALGFLDEGDSGAVSNAENALYFATKAAAYSNDLDDALSSLKEAAFNLKNANEALRDFRDGLEFSDEEYDELESRISVINRLFRKYNKDEQGLIDYCEICRNKIGEIEYSDERISKLKAELSVQENICLELAAKLSEERKSAALKLENRVVKELCDLNMPSVRFKVGFSECDLSKNGRDNVYFIMSANAGEELGRISKIASGGELSRIMLALKNVFAEKDIVDTMIFDEIDSGVSGISAQRVAEKLFTVSKNKQVMCISHLPQIAAMADNEYLVVKSEKNGRTYTEVNLLDFEGRKKEIARMFGGENITELTLEAASEQLAKAGEFKK